MSKFVSAGTNEEPIERDEAWLKAQQDIEAKRQRDAELQKQDGGKSLFEVLQANKAAKQEAFEESIRLKNQFRSLDDDEVEFLDSVLESTRAKEAAVRKETSEQLESFRKQQEDAERVTLTEGQATSPTEEQESWVFAGKKRRKAKEKEVLPGVKLRKVSSSSEKPDVNRGKPSSSVPDSQPDKKIKSTTQPASTEASTTDIGKSPSSLSDSISPVREDARSAKPTSVPGLGLGDYSSDDE